MERLTVPFEVKHAEPESGEIWGIGSVFGNVDLQGDRVVKGAFRQTLKDRGGAPIPMLWSHDVTTPIGTWTSAVETDVGLKVEGRFSLGVQRAREIRDLVKDRAVQGLSIGYRIPNGGATVSEHVRELHRIDLLELSLCCFPANGSARIGGMKSEEVYAYLRDRVQSEDDLVELLKEAGLSRRARGRAIIQYRTETAPAPIEQPPPESLKAQLRRAFKEAEALEAAQQKAIRDVMGWQFCQTAKQRVDQSKYEREVSLQEARAEWEEKRKQFLQRNNLSPNITEEELKKRYPWGIDSFDLPQYPEYGHTDIDFKSYDEAREREQQKEFDAVMLRIKGCRDQDELIDLLESYQWKESDIEQFKKLRPFEVKA